MSDVENPYANPTIVAPPLSPAEEKQFAVLTHVLSIFFGLMSAAVFFFVYRNRGPFIREHTTAEWNFQLTVLIVAAIGMVMSFTGAFVGLALSAGGERSGGAAIGFFFVGYVLILVVRLGAAILGIRASIVANKGRLYHYPAFRFAR
jgi:uncharacterized Tic20 family protein